MAEKLCASSSAKSPSHSCGDVSLFGWAASLRPGLNLAKRRAQRGSTLAGGHRQGRREAALMAASTARSLGKPGRSCRLPQHLLFVLGQVIHVEVTHGLEPVLVHLDSQRPHQPQAALLVRKDAHHMRAPLDLLV